MEAGFAESDVIIERTYRTPMTEHAFLEPECALAVPAGYDGVRPPNSKEKAAVEYDSDKLTVYVGSQIPYSDRRQVAKSLGLDDEEVRVIGTLMGGGFGGKEDIAGQIHAALGAQVTGRPVKILYSRQESLIFHPKRHSTIIRIKTGAKRDGTLIAVEAELYGDSGAYASLGEKVMTRATTHATGPYVMPHARIDCYAMYTNNAPSGAFRGFGVTQSAFAVESNLDILAAELGMDPTELRRKNVMRVGGETATGQELIESVGLLECLDKVEEEIKTSEAAGPSSLPSDPGLRSRSAASATPGGSRPATRIPAWGAARRTRRRPKWRFSPTALLRSAPAARRWGRIWSACWRPAPRRSWACPTRRCMSP